MSKKYVTVCRRDMSSDPPRPCPECGHGGYQHRPFIGDSEVCLQCQIDMINARLENLGKKT